MPQFDTISFLLLSFFTLTSLWAFFVMLLRFSTGRSLLSDNFFYTTLFFPSFLSFLTFYYVNLVRND